MIQNIITCDLEDWYHPSLINGDVSQWDQFEPRIIEPTERILDILRAKKSKATFFVLGYIAERFPDLVKRIHDEGHEIASHGYNHELVYNQSPEEFRRDLRRSLEILSKLTGDDIRGYRAPSWSVKEEFAWFWKTLAEEDIWYDSSLFPLNTFLYGDSKTPRFIHERAIDNGAKLIEMPPTVMEYWGRRIPFSGGFYLRLLPLPLVKYFIRKLNKDNHPVIVYFHPWEIDKDQPRMPLSRKNYFIQYVNIQTMERKLIKLMDEFRFISMRHYFNQMGKEIDKYPGCD